MSDAVNVLVVFYSRYGEAEKLALAAGLGAIQENGNIRLRRLADLAPADVISCDAPWTSNLSRMLRDYVTPRPADPVWADAIVLAMPARSEGELQKYVASLPSCGPMHGKIAAPLTSAHGVDALAPVYGVAACAGLLVVPAALEAGDRVAAATEHGRALVRTVRALRAAPTA